MIRNSIIYLVVTVQARTNKFELRMKEPKTLAPNQFLFRFRLSTDVEAWRKRISEVQLGQVSPPETLLLERDPALSLKVGLTTAQIVLNRMTVNEQER